MTDTPRTDAQGYGDGRHPYVPTEFARQLERQLAAITCEEGELWELRQENARLKDNLSSLSKLHANEAEEWGKRENWRMSSVCRELRAELDATKQELEQARQDAKQSDLDAIRALGERNDARAALTSERALADRLADALQDIEGRASDESVLLHPDADAKGVVDDCWEWSEQALAAWKAARIDAHLDRCVEKSAQSWKPLPGDPEQFYPR